MRFSRAAIVGACWAGVAILAAGFSYVANNEGGPGQTPTTLGYTLAFTLVPLGLAAPLGTTILGWIAVSQIRRSAGRLYGLGLAVFEGLLFPLLALDALIAVGFKFLGAAIVLGFDLPRTTPLSTLHVLMVVVIVLVDWWIIRRVWRMVGKPDDRRAGAPGNRPARVGWFVAAGFAVIAAVVWLAASIASRTHSDNQSIETLPAITGEIAFPKIDRTPQPNEESPKELKTLPKYDADSDDPWQLDLRCRDVSKLDLRNSIDDLLYASFDDRTVWPAMDNMPSDFNSQRIMELGKNPGLGVRSLHREGITGRGVRIAIIDQPLLVDHQEYADRLQLYEEIHIQSGMEPQMHGPAVASIAVGETVGVAPEAELFYIAQWNFDWEKKNTPTLRYLAQGIHRIVEINDQLPQDNKIRVLSISKGWTPNDLSRREYNVITEAVQRARAAGMLVVCTSVELVHEGLDYDVLGRSPLADPDVFGSYEPALFAAGWFWTRRHSPSEDPDDNFFVPIDSRTTASPAGIDEYVFYRRGGSSWAVPYIAGVYALAVQVDPSITPDRFWALAARTGRTFEIEQSGKRRPLGPIIDPVKLIRSIEATAPSHLTDTPNSSFGPVMERVVSGEGNQNPRFIDFDTGRLIASSEFFDPEDEPSPEETRQWWRETGIDAMGETGPTVNGLLGLEMAAVPAPGEEWGRAMPARLNHYLAMGELGTPITMSGNTELPVTFAIKTREGAQGLLQITGFIKDPPGVKIRYKLVQVSDTSSGADVPGHEVLRIKLKGAETTLSDLETRFAAGQVSPVEVERVRLEVEVLKAQLEGNEMQVAAVQLEGAQHLLELMEQRYKAGLIPRSELVAARTEVEVREYELEALSGLRSGYAAGPLTARVELMESDPARRFWRWRVFRQSGARMIFGVLDVTDPNNPRQVLIGTENKPAALTSSQDYTLRLDRDLDGWRVEVESAWAGEDGGHGSTRDRIDVPPGANLHATTHEQVGTLSTSQYHVFWLGELDLDGRLLKSLRFVGRLAEADDPIQNILDETDPVRTFDLDLTFPVPGGVTPRPTIPRTPISYRGMILGLPLLLLGASLLAGLVGGTVWWISAGSRTGTGMGRAALALGIGALPLTAIVVVLLGFLGIAATLFLFPLFLVFEIPAFALGLLSRQTGLGKAAMILSATLLLASLAFALVS